MEHNLKIVLPYEGLKKYISAVRAAESPDHGRLWLEYAFDPYWNEWAAGQFTEERTRSEMSDPVTDIDELETAADLLIASDTEGLLRNTYDKINTTVEAQISSDTAGRFSCLACAARQA